MKRAVITGAIAILLVAAGIGAASANRGHDRDDDFEARLSSYQEVPALSTPASGRFEADVDRGDQELRYTLSIRDVATPVLFAHIHFAQKGVNGGVIAFLCGGGGKPACPQSGTVEGTIVPADVVGPAAQGIAAGEFEELVDAMEAGVTYVNVHSQAFPGGEIRGQIHED